MDFEVKNNSIAFKIFDEVTDYKATKIYGIGSLGEEIVPLLKLKYLTVLNHGQLYNIDRNFSYSFLSLYSKDSDQKWENLNDITQHKLKTTLSIFIVNISSEKDLENIKYLVKREKDKNTLCLGLISINFTHVSFTLKNIQANTQTDKSTDKLSEMLNFKQQLQSQVQEIFHGSIFYPFDIFVHFKDVSFQNQLLNKQIYSSQQIYIDYLNINEKLYFKEVIQIIMRVLTKE